MFVDIESKNEAKDEEEEEEDEEEEEVPEDLASLPPKQRNIRVPIIILIFYCIFILFVACFILNMLNYVFSLFYRYLLGIFPILFGYYLDRVDLWTNCFCTLIQVDVFFTYFYTFIFSIFFNFIRYYLDQDG